MRAPAAADRPAQVDIADSGEPMPLPGAPADAGSRKAPVRMDTMVEELLTTARRRNEPVQTAPVAVTSISESMLTSGDTRRLSDLSGSVPSVTIDGALGAANASRISIRGLGSGVTSTAFDPGVGVFVDGVYQPRAQSQLLPLYDVERVEVIRGPQGTLFGKNTVGGAIAVTTRKPEFNSSGKASIRVGSFNEFDTRLAMNVPLVSERAAARFSLASNYDDGYQNNVFRSQNLGNDRLLGGRAELLLLPSDSLEVLLTGEYTQQDRRPQAGKCKVVGPASAPIQAIQGPQLLQDMFAACAADEQRSDRKFASDIEAEDDLRQTQLSAQISWEISDRLTLRSVTGFNTLDNDIRQDLDGSQLGFAQSPSDSGGIDAHSLSQELQLTGRSSDDRLVYVLGVFALRDDSDDDTSFTGSLMAVELRRRGNNVLPLVDERRDVENRSYAAYGQVTYGLTDRLSITAGLRRTLERKALRKIDTSRTDGIDLGTVPPSLLAPGDINFQLDRSARFSDYSPNATISYQLTPTVLTYVGYSTGFRSGGFNGSATALNPDTAKLDPEEITSYQLGLKATFLDSRLRVNTEAFYGIYEELQRPVPGPSVAGAIPSLSLTNAAEARVHGLELELVALPIPGLQLDTSISAFRSRYSEFDTTADPRASRARLPAQPNYLMSFGASYEFPLGSLGILSTRTRWVHRGTQANDVADSPSVRSGKYGLLDARIALLMSDSRTELALFGSNLLDRSFFNNGFDVSSTVGVATRFQGPPRRYGVELTRQF